MHHCGSFWPTYMNGIEPCFLQKKLSVGLLHRHIWHGLQKFWRIWLTLYLLDCLTKQLNSWTEQIKIYERHSKRQPRKGCTEFINDESATPVHAQHVKTATVNTDWYIDPIYRSSMIEYRSGCPFNLGFSSGGEPFQYRLSVRMSSKTFLRSLTHTSKIRIQ